MRIVTTPRLGVLAPLVVLAALVFAPSVATAQKDIGVHNLCVTRGDPAKICTDVLYTGQTWHSRFQVVNKGMKPVTNWSFSIFVVGPGGQQIIIKDQVDGTPLNPGQVVTINWPSHYLFSSADKGPWQIVVDVRVKQANPDVSPVNNRTTAQFVVENKPEGVSDIGLEGVCVSRATAAAKQCTDVLFTEQPWHVMFKVINKGEKAVDNWSFDIVLTRVGAGQPPIVVKQQVAGTPLPVGGVTTMNWPMPQTFSPADKGQWTVDVLVEVKDPTNPEPPERQTNNRGSATFVVENKPVPRSDIGIETVCVTLGGTPNKVCTDAVFTQQPWHVMFKVINKGDKPVDNWSFDIFLSAPGQPLITLKQQVAGPQLPLGGAVTINWPSPHIFDPTQKGDWKVIVFATVKDPGNPEPPELQGNNRGSAGFTVQNKPVGISDIGVNSVCVTRGTTAADKVCTGTIFTQQPWHVMFTVVNKGEKAVDDWSFDIVLTQPGLPTPIVLKQQVAGHPLPVGAVTTINWPSPHIFDPMQKGPWTVEVGVEVKDPNNPEPPDHQSNNRSGATFQVQNKPTPRSDIGVRAVCVTRADTTKECTDLLFTQQPWHIQFEVVNKGDKPVDNWSFDIFLGSAGPPPGPFIPLKQQITGSPLQVGEVRTINWPSPQVFDPTQKGQWTVMVRVEVKDPTNPEPPVLQDNNRGSATFTVRNKEVGVSDIGIQALCVTRADPLKQCSDILFTRQPWHVMFTVTNKGAKAVDDWSFDILLAKAGQVPIVLKQQVAGTPLPVGGNVTINWPSPYIFDGSQKGQWQVGLRVEVKDPGNPEPTDRQHNNRAVTPFTVENKTEVSDIGIDSVCVTLANAASNKDCSPYVFIDQPWHIKFVAFNKGEKALDNWSFDIGLTGASDLLLKQQVAGPVIPVGGRVTINWPSPLLFDPAMYGIWTVGVSAEVKDPTNPEPTPLQQNNRGSATFQVVNKVAVDGGISEARLRSNVPNPFAIATTIQYELPRAARTELEVFDLNGRLVKRLVTSEVGAGPHTTTWDGTDESGARAAAGVYIYRLKAGSFMAARRMVLIN